MTAHEIRPKQLRALLLLLVLVPLIPIALMARFMSDALKGDRVEAISRTQQFHAELLASALRAAPVLLGTPPERAARLHAHIRGFAEPSVSIRIVDGNGNLLAGSDSQKGQMLAQEHSPAGLPGLIQLFLQKSDVIDEAVSGQQRIYIVTGLFVTLLVIAIAGTAAMTVTPADHSARVEKHLGRHRRARIAHAARIHAHARGYSPGRPFRNEQQLREYLDLIAGENERLRRIAENFLTFSRLDRGSHALMREPVAVGSLAAQAVAPFAARLAAPGCTFTMEIADSLPAILADAEALSQVIANLVDNSLKYTGDEKRISLRARKEGSMLAIVIEDNGIGIAPEQRRSRSSSHFTKLTSGSRAPGRAQDSDSRSFGASSMRTTGKSALQVSREKAACSL